MFQTRGQVGKECTANASKKFAPNQIFVGHVQNFSSGESVSLKNKGDQYRTACLGLNRYIS